MAVFAILTLRNVADAVFLANQVLNIMEPRQVEIDQRTVNIQETVIDFGAAFDGENVKAQNFRQAVWFHLAGAVPDWTAPPGQPSRNLQMYPAAGGATPPLAGPATNHRGYETLGHALEAILASVSPPTGVTHAHLQSISGTGQRAVSMERSAGTPGISYGFMVWLDNVPAGAGRTSGVLPRFERLGEVQLRYAGALGPPIPLQYERTLIWPVPPWLQAIQWDLRAGLTGSLREIRPT